MRTSPYLGFALLVAAFVVFLFYGNIAPAIVFLALGVVLVVSGARRKSNTRATTEGDPK